MSTKIKVFELKDENSKAISDFLGTVNVTQDGFLINNGNLGILYREKDNLGMERDQLAVAISGELSKAQKQFILQEGLCRAYTAMIKLFKERTEEKQKLFDIKSAELVEYNKKWDSVLEKEVLDGKARLGAMEKKYKGAGKLQKPALEKEAYELSQKMKPAEDKFNAYKKEFDAGKYALELEIGTLKLEIANLGGDIKENKGLLENSEKDREHAKVFITTTSQLIDDINAKKVDEEALVGLKN